MSDIETAEEFVESVWHVGVPTGSSRKEWWTGKVIARDAAIRRQVAEDVLDKIDLWHDDNSANKYATLKGMTKHLRSEYAPQEKAVNTNQTATETSSAHDAEVSRKAKVEVLRDAYQAWLSNPSTSARERQSDISRQYWDGIAARHNITAAELEPPKPEIKVEQSPFNRDCRQITHGHFFWNGATWVDDEADAINYTPHDAEAIAAKLRADGNYPGGGK